MSANSFANLFFKVFPPPILLDTPSAGLSISDDAVRAIKFAHGKHHLEVESFAELALPDGLIEAGFINDEKKLVELLQKFRTDNALSYVHASLPEEKMYIFSTDVPTTDPDDIHQNIEFKLEENVPLSPANAMFSYHLIPRGNSNHQKVGVSVAPRKVVDAYLSLFEKAGFTPVSFELEAQALARAVFEDTLKGARVLVHIMNKKTGIYVVTDGVVRFTSTIPLGSNAITEAVSKAFNVSLEEARKIQYARTTAGTEETKKLFSAVINVLSGLKDEISKVISYWHTHEDGQHQVHAVVLSGRDALIPGFAEYVATNSSVTVSVADVWKNVCVFDKYVPPIPYEESLNYGVAIGLAL
ncbi:MAG: pilus assembly protein PilM [Patescibacteria group bacterium]